MWSGIDSICGFKSGGVVAEMEDELVEWQRWAVVLLQCTFPTFITQGFLGNRSRDLRRCDFSDAPNGPLHGLPRKPQPTALIYRCLQLLLA